VEEAASTAAASTSTHDPLPPPPPVDEPQRGVGGADRPVAKAAVAKGAVAKGGSGAAGRAAVPVAEDVVRVVSIAREDGHSLGIKITDMGGLHLVSGIAPASPAAKAGVRAGEYVIEINGADVVNHPHSEFIELIGAPRAGPLVLTLTKLPPVVASAVTRTVRVAKAPGSSFGMVVESVVEGVEYHIVSDVVENSPSAAAGVASGDRILGINGQLVAGQTHEAVIGLLRSTGDSVELTLSCFGIAPTNE
jgi:carboxyl-terminal processing protease